MASILNVDEIKNAAGTGTPIIDGHVLQVVKAEHSSTTQLTSSGAAHELTTSIRLAITPISASSTLYFNFFAPFTFPNSANLSYAYFYDVTNSAAINLPTASGSRRATTWQKRTRPFDPNDMDTLNMSDAVASGSTTARTYTIYHSTEGAVAQFLQSTLSSSAGTNSKMLFTITEVA
tara:strand:- start:380 stop:910 length:531 start_codon:yes stop_codon:yes gene_type:complete